MAGETSGSKQATMLSMTRKQEASGVEGTLVPRRRKGEAMVPTQYQKLSFRSRLKLGIRFVFCFFWRVQVNKMKLY